MATRLFGPRRRLIQAIEQITGKASSATAPPATTTTVNKQASSPSGTTNESSKIDTEQEEHVCLSIGVFVCHLCVGLSVCLCVSPSILSLTTQNHRNVSS